MATRKTRAPSRKSTPKTLNHCINGPWEGARLALDPTSGSCTAWLQIGPLVGRYVHGAWEAMKPAANLAAGD